jgi:hypothetical protein
VGSATTFNTCLVLRLSKCGCFIVYDELLSSFYLGRANFSVFGMPSISLDAPTSSSEPLPPFYHQISETIVSHCNRNRYHT